MHYRVLSVPKPKLGKEGQETQKHFLDRDRAEHTHWSSDLGLVPLISVQDTQTVTYLRGCCDGQNKGGNCGAAQIEQTTLERKPWDELRCASVSESNVTAVK